MVVQLHVYVDGPSRLLPADLAGELPGIVRGDVAEQVLKAVPVREAPVLGRQHPGRAIKARGRDCLHLAPEAPAPSGRRVVAERPEGGYVGDLGHATLGGCWRQPEPTAVRGARSSA